MKVDDLQLASAPGTYILLMRLERGWVRTIGSLGEISFAPGWYAYVGSAFGPGGLAARVGRHLGPAGKRHWHIDHLLGKAWVTGIWTAAGPQRLEHRWAAALSRPHLRGRAVAGFGSSDCRCVSHLFHFTAMPDPARLGRALGAQWHTVRHGRY